MRRLHVVEDEQESVLSVQYATQPTPIKKNGEWRQKEVVIRM